MFAVLRPAFPFFALVIGIRLDDTLHQFMPHDVLFGQIALRDTLYPVEHTQRFFQAGLLTVRQVNLRNIARDNRLRTKPEASQEHFHLLGRRCSALRPK